MAKVIFRTTRSKKGRVVAYYRISRDGPKYFVERRLARGEKWITIATRYNIKDAKNALPIMVV